MFDIFSLHLSGYDSKEGTYELSVTCEDGILPIAQDEQEDDLQQVEKEKKSSVEEKKSSQD